MIFTREPKPFEVEVSSSRSVDGATSTGFFRVSYDGTLYDERKFVAIGGKAEQLVEAASRSSGTTI